MKKIFPLFMTLGFLMSSCDYWVEMYIINNSDKELIIYSPFHTAIIREDNLANYPDTIIKDQYAESLCSNIIMPHDTSVFFEENIGNIWGKNRYDYIIETQYKLLGVDTVSFYIFFYEELGNPIQDSLINGINYRQRYDLSKDDAYKFLKYGYLSFPPSPEMKDIKMWPPYGTYDEKGNRIK